MFKTKYKKLVSICLTMILAFSVTLPVYAEKWEVLDFANNPQLEFDCELQKGHLTIGEGIEYRRLRDIITNHDDRCKIKTITIKDYVTKIGNEAFYLIDRGCTSSNKSFPNLKEINIPESVTEIGDGAFRDCKYLKSITIPRGVTKIGMSAFSGCEKLNSIIIEKGNFDYKFIDGVLFSKYKTLLHTYLASNTANSYTIPNSVTEIGDGAFRDCTNLKSITIPEGVTKIGNYAFDGCTNLKEINIPNSVTTIGCRAFRNCRSLKSIDIPNSVTFIDKFAFNWCESLKSITIPSSINSINDGTFYFCTGLKSVTIPNSVKKIGKYAFDNCTNLKDVNIPNGVETIDECAFGACEYLKSVTIPNSVTTIGWAFFNGIYLKEMYLEAGCTLSDSDIRNNCGNNIKIIRQKPSCQKIDRRSDLVGKDCIICLDKFKVGDEVARLPCSPNQSHYYHKRCIYSHIRFTREGKIFKCPLCRRGYVM